MSTGIRLGENISNNRNDGGNDGEKKYGNKSKSWQ